MLDIIKVQNKIVVQYNGNAITTLNSKMPFNQQVRTVFYMLGQVNPSISRDLVEYELSNVKDLV